MAFKMVAVDMDWTMLCCKHPVVFMRGLQDRG